MSVRVRCFVAALVWVVPLVYASLGVALLSGGWKSPAPLILIFVLGHAGTIAWGVALGLWMLRQILQHRLRDLLRSDALSWAAGAAFPTLLGAGVLIVAVIGNQGRQDRWETTPLLLGAALPVLQQVWAALFATLWLLLRPAALPGVAASVTGTGLASVAALMFSYGMR